MCCGGFETAAQVEAPAMYRAESRPGRSGVGSLLTTGHGAAWSAALTDAGDEYIASAEGSNPPVPRQANGSTTHSLST